MIVKMGGRIRQMPDAFVDARKYAEQQKKLASEAVDIAAALILLVIGGIVLALFATV